MGDRTYIRALKTLSAVQPDRPRLCRFWLAGLAAALEAASICGAHWPLQCLLAFLWRYTWVAVPEPLRLRILAPARRLNKEAYETFKGMPTEITRRGVVENGMLCLMHLHALHWLLNMDRAFSAWQRGKGAAATLGGLPAPELQLMSLTCMSQRCVQRLRSRPVLQWLHVWLLIAHASWATAHLERCTCSLERCENPLCCTVLCSLKGRGGIVSHRCSSPGQAPKNNQSRVCRSLTANFLHDVSWSARRAARQPLHVSASPLAQSGPAAGILSPPSSKSSTPLAGSTTPCAFPLAPRALPFAPWRTAAALWRPHSACSTARPLLTPS